MLPLSPDPSFHFELLRVLALARYHGSDISEILLAASRITPGSFASFSAVFTSLADRISSQAATIPLTSPVSRRDAYFRAASYYRCADFYLHGNPADPRINDLWGKHIAAFDKAIALLPVPGRRVVLQADGFSVPAIFYRSSVGGKGAKPVVLMGNGYDGAQEEMLHVSGFAALERGYHVLTYEGPGQPTVRREQGLGFIAEWERVVTPCVDFLQTLTGDDEVDMGKIGLIGYSMGGVLAVRAAAYEKRIAAVIAIDGVNDVFEGFMRAMGPEMRQLVESGDKEKIDEICRQILAGSGLPTVTRWGIEQGLWSFNTDSVFEYLERTRGMTLKGIEDKVHCPVWLGDPVNDLFFKGQPEEAKNALGDKATLVIFGEEDAASEHCHMGASVLMNQVVFDWFQGIIRKD